MTGHIPKGILQSIAIALIAPVVIMCTQSSAEFNQVNTTSFGVAIKGYDPVAYHTENRAVKGKSDFTYQWNDAEWHFSSAANRDLFAADPLRYAPQYGGY